MLALGTGLYASKDYPSDAGKVVKLALGAGALSVKELNDEWFPHLSRDELDVAIVTLEASNAISKKVADGVVKYHLK